ncbi:hypothetical protein [Hyphococcus sp.]|uniref:hypothetical protein n=1 Tax=Hyphococcus sp. TaxID=2038636 RepID=UPI0035C6F18E
MIRCKTVSLIAAAILTGACQTAAPKTEAVLAAADDRTIAQVKSVLAEAVGRASIELGAGEPAKDTFITVLPPPLASREDRSMATPVVFDIVLSGGDCYAVRRDTGEAFRLSVACRAAG